MSDYRRHLTNLLAFAVGVSVIVVVLNEVLSLGAIEPTPAAVDALAPSPAFSLLPLALVVGVLLFMAGVLPIPVGYDRGKIKWLTWCGTGMHAHICYWHGDRGLQTIHPNEVDR